MEIIAHLIDDAFMSKETGNINDFTLNTGDILLSKNAQPKYVIVSFGDGVTNLIDCQKKQIISVTNESFWSHIGNYLLFRNVEMEQISLESGDTFVNKDGTKRYVCATDIYKDEHLNDVIKLNILTIENEAGVGLYVSNKEEIIVSVADLKYST